MENSRFKFRAWDKDEKEMRPKKGGFYLGSVNSELISGDDLIMQYTGLKDKNGKEIYEGDVIEHIQGIYDRTKIKEKVFWNDELAGFNPFSDYDSDCDIYVEMETVEIIGNIHENPELLEGK